MLNGVCSCRLDDDGSYSSKSDSNTHQTFSCISDSITFLEPQIVI
jgi:hypothetical protein